MTSWTLETSTAGAVTSLLLRGRPGSVGAWERCCTELAAAWPLSGRVELEVRGPGPQPQRLRGGAPEALVAAADSLMRRRERSRAPLLVRAGGTLMGPWLALALSGELLVVDDDMAAAALFWEDSRLLVPGELLAVAARLGRARALEWALAGAPFGAAELLDRRAAVGGEAGPAAWDSARRGSLVAQEAAASLMRSREPGRAAFETLERTAFAACFAQADLKEGVAAFAQRRAPDFPSHRPKTRS